MSNSWWDYMDSRLKDAASTGDIHVLKQLQEEKPDILMGIDSNSHYQTAAHLALLSEQVKFAMEICSREPRLIIKQDEYGDTPLHIALTFGFTDFILHCLDLLQPQQREKTTTRPTFDLPSDRSFLLNNTGHSLLYLAADYGNVEAVRSLLQSPLGDLANGPNNSTALHSSVYQGNYEISKEIVKQQPQLLRQLDGNGYTPLHRAVYNDNEALVKLLLLHDDRGSASAIRKHAGFSPLQLAASRGSPAVFEAIIQYLINRNDLHSCFRTTDDQKNVLHLAVENRKTSIVEYITSNKMLKRLAYGQDQEGNTPLHIAAKMDYSEMLTIFINNLQIFENPTIKNHAGLSPLQLAVFHGSLAIFEGIIEHLLSRNDIDSCSQKTDDQKNILHLAVENKNESIVKYITSNKMLQGLATAQDLQGNTPFHIAINMDDCNLQMIFINNQIQEEISTIKNAAGFSPLHLAVMRGSFEAFEGMMKHLVSRNDIDSCSHTTDSHKNVLHLAVESRNATIVEYIISNNMLRGLANVADQQGNTPFDIAANMDNSNLPSIFIRKRLMKPMDPRLMTAAKSGDMKMLERLYKENPSILMGIDDTWGTACHIALLNGKIQFAQEICSQRKLLMLIPDGNGATPLHIALGSDQPDFVRYSVELLQSDDLESGKKYFEVFEFDPSFIVSKDGKSLVYLAIEKEHLEAAMCLLHSPLGADFSGPNNSTALHIAVLKNADEIAKELVEKQPQLVEQPDGDGNTPLHHAISEGNETLVEILLSKDANTTAAASINHQGFSPLHLAVSAGNVKIFECVVNHLLSRNNRDSCYKKTNDQKNILHVAVENRNASIVECITSNKMLRQLAYEQDLKGNTPFHIAGDMDDPRMLMIFLNNKITEDPTIKNVFGLTVTEVIKARKESQEKEKQEKIKESLDAMGDLKSSLLVMATLITTVTFTAAFTMPGGYKSDAPDQGTAILESKGSFKLFVLSDTIAMCSSILATSILLTFSRILNTQKRLTILNIAIWSIGMSSVFMLVAFAAAVYVVIGSQRRWLSVSTIAMAVITLLSIAILITYMLKSEVEDEGENKRRKFQRAKKRKKSLGSKKQM